MLLDFHALMEVWFVYIPTTDSRIACFSLQIRVCVRVASLSSCITCRSMPATASLGIWRKPFAWGCSTCSWLPSIYSWQWGRDCCRLPPISQHGRSSYSNFLHWKHWAESMVLSSAWPYPNACEDHFLEWLQGYWELIWPRQGLATWNIIRVTYSFSLVVSRKSSDQWTQTTHWYVHPTTTCKSCTQWSHKRCESPPCTSRAFLKHYRAIWSPLCVICMQCVLCSVNVCYMCVLSQTCNQANLFTHTHLGIPCWWRSDPVWSSKRKPCAAGQGSQLFTQSIPRARNCSPPAPECCPLAQWEGTVQCCGVPVPQRISSFPLSCQMDRPATQTLPRSVHFTQFLYNHNTQVWCRYESSPPCFCPLPPFALPFRLHQNQS